MNRLFSLMVFLVVAGIICGVEAWAMSGYLPKFGPEDVWRLDGEVALYDESNVYDYINGEAELFYPYGFEMVATALYVHGEDESRAVVADIYRMGEHPLEAYGIYSNNRDPEGVDPGVGWESALNDYQLMFVRDRYFIRMSAYGEPENNRNDLVEIGKKIEQRLPEGNQEALKQWLALVQVAGRPDARSVQYQAESLLGYDFLPCGLEVNTEVEGQPVRALLVFFGDSHRPGLKAWAEKLENEGSAVEWQSGKDPDWDGFLAEDSMYGQVLAISKGNLLFCLVGLDEPPKDIVQFGSAVVGKLQQQQALLARDPKPPWE